MSERDETTTALVAPWSLGDYDRWMREEEERDEVERDKANIRILQRFDPEMEASVRAAEEGWGYRVEDPLTVRSIERGNR